MWIKPQILTQLNDTLLSSGQFTSISGPLDFNGFTFTSQQIAQLHVQSAASPLNQALGQFISPDGKTIKFYGILKAGATGTLAATNAMPQIRTRLDAIATKVQAERATIYSQDAVTYDISHIATSDLTKIIPIVLVIIAVLLAMMLRSLVAPLYLIATVGLSYVATLNPKPASSRVKNLVSLSACLPIAARVVPVAFA